MTILQPQTYKKKEMMYDPTPMFQLFEVYHTCPALAACPDCVLHKVSVVRAMPQSVKAQSVRQRGETTEKGNSGSMHLETLDSSTHCAFKRQTHRMYRICML